MNYDVIIIGAGPGGIFSAYELSKERPDLKIAVFEAGHALAKRKCPIDGVKIKTCIECKSCSIMSGFGGAGAFSDGKLNTGTKDIRHRFILEHLVACGAPEDILINAKPHIGTDKLKSTVKAIREEIIALGVNFEKEFEPKSSAASKRDLSSFDITE